MTAALETLQQKAERAHAAFEKAKAEADAAAAQELADRQARLDAHDRQQLAAYDWHALSAAIADARAELVRVAAADPVVAAQVRLHFAVLEQAHLRAEAAQTALRLGIGDVDLGPERAAGNPDPELLSKIIANLAEDQNAAAVQQRADARDAAAGG